MALSFGAILRLPKIGAVPTNPPENQVLLYAKSDGLLYSRDSAGVETLLSGKVVKPGGGGAAGALKTVEIDFGPQPQLSGRFNVPDVSVTAASSVLAGMSGTAATGRAADEAEMDPLNVRATPGDGYVLFYVDALHGPVTGNYKIHYLVG